MQGALIHIQGHWAQFRKPETNNTPLTHDFLTKTAFIGLIGAVLGIERDELRKLYPSLCDSLLYGVQVRCAVKKVSWAFTLRNVHKPNDPLEKAPRQMEFLSNPNYTVVLGLQDETSRDIFQRFVNAVQKSEACYTPVLGLHNCPAELAWIGDTTFEQAQGKYVTKGFALRSHKLTIDASQPVRMNFERIPTFQDSDWWNVPDRYREVVYSFNDGLVSMEGDHFLSREGDAWCLI